VKSEKVKREGAGSGAAPGAGCRYPLFLIHFFTVHFLNVRAAGVRMIRELIERLARGAGGGPEVMGDEEFEKLFEYGGEEEQDEKHAGGAGDAGGKF
jgi:hypothetical protein